VSTATIRAPHRFNVRNRFPLSVAGDRQTPAPGSETWREQTDLILNAAGEGVYGLDVEGRCTFVNPAAARMTGHTVDELLGQSMHALVHHSHAEGGHYHREECPIYAAFADGMVRNVCDEVFWRKDGSAFPVEYTSTPIYNERVLVGAVVVFRDITLRAQTEQRLRSALAEVQLLKERLQLENTTLRQEIETVRGIKEIVGNSGALRAMTRRLAPIAASNCTVCIHGETGTGKELVARAVHRLSARRTGPMVRVNCSSLGSQLADSELFGHERGAFTGAVQRRAGRFEQARGGTLFLDEVAELPLEAQAKLLRVLQEREFERVGGNEMLTADVRIIAATNRDLKQRVKAGLFRADLFFRLNVVPITVPPLRERTSDIPALVDEFLHRLEETLGRHLPRATEADLKRLGEYDWPGNVRELQNVIERAAVFSDGISLEIPQDLRSLDTGVEAEVRTETELVVNEGARSLPPFVDEHERPVDALVRPPGTPDRELLSLEEVERRHVQDVLEKTKWRLAGPHGASAILGLHPNTLRHRMKKLGITR
jgi:PAS domain S-box-containing protein